MTQHCGPDQLFPATEKWTWRANQAVKINAEDEDLATDPPISLVTALRRVAENHPERLAIVDPNEGREDVYTYKRYYESVLQVAKAFIKLGLESNHVVAIAGVNSPQWFITYMASIFAGGIFFGLHYSKSEEFKKTLLEMTKCNIVVAEDETKVQGILSMWDSLPHLKAIIQYMGKPKDGLPNVYSWDDVIKMNVEPYEKDLQRRILSIAPNKCCTLATTSGTTATSKVVMYSHDNLLWPVKRFMEYCNEGQFFPPDIIVSYQNLSTMTAAFTDIFWPLLCGGGTVHIAKPDALPVSLMHTLRLVRPTFMLAVTGVWEFLMEQCLAPEMNADVTNFLKMKQDLSINSGTSGTEAQKNMAAKLGLDRCRIGLVGGRFLKKEILQFYLSLNIPLMDSYGLTESAFVTANRRSNFKQGTVGRVITGFKLKFKNYSGENHILLTGRNVFMGYLEDEKTTREAFDEDGYFDSADIGFMDEDDFLVLSGRCSNMIIKRDCDNVYPEPIEQMVLSFLPCLSHCVLVGEGQEFLYLLIVFRTKIDPRTRESTDMLDDLAVEWCRSIGVDAEKLSDICNSKDPKLVSAIQEAIDKTNSNAAMAFQLIKKWTILPEGFSFKGGELSATMKVKRQKVLEKYRKIIEELYDTRKSI